MKKKIIISGFVTVMVLGAFAIKTKLGNHHSHQHETMQAHFDKMTTELELTVRQQDDLKEFHQRFIKTINNLKSSELTEDAFHNAMITALATMRFDIKNILSNTQLAKVQCMPAEKNMGLMMSMVQHVRNEEASVSTQEKLLTQRRKFESNLTSAEKEIITSVRALANQHQSRILEDGIEMSKEEFISAHLAMETILSPLTSIIQVHKTEILDFLKTCHSTTNIHNCNHNGAKGSVLHSSQEKSHLCPNTNNGVNKHHKRMKMIHFVLINPANSVSTTSKIKTFPNPTQENATIEYTVTVPGPVKVSLLDQNGEMKKVLFDGNQIAGTHQLDADLSDFSGSGFCIVSLVTNEITESTTTKLFFNK